jgi:hypothetical protein
MKGGMLYIYRMMQSMDGFLGWIIGFYVIPTSRCFEALCRVNMCTRHHNHAALVTFHRYKLDRILHKIWSRIIQDFGQKSKICLFIHLTQSENPYWTQNSSQPWVTATDPLLMFGSRNRDGDQEDGFKEVLLIEWDYVCAIWDVGMTNLVSWPREWRSGAKSVSGGFHRKWAYEYNG